MQRENSQVQETRNVNGLCYFRSIQYRSETIQVSLLSRAQPFRVSSRRNGRRHIYSVVDICSVLTTWNSFAKTNRHDLTGNYFYKLFKCFAVGVENINFSVIVKRFRIHVNASLPAKRFNHFYRKVNAHFQTISCT